MRQVTGCVIAGIFLAGATAPVEGQSPVPYSVASYTDISNKAMGSQSLSDFTPAELARLPENRGARVRVVVPDTIREAQVRPTVQAIVSDLATQDPDLDEIALHIFSSREQERAGGAPDVARAIWSTGGDLGGITPEIARENLRANYAISVKILPADLEAYLAGKRENVTRQGLSEVKRKEIFRALVRAEDRASNEAQRRYPVMCVGTAELRANRDRYYEYKDSLRTAYVREVREEFEISEATLDSITTESSRERWPLPEPLPTPHCP